MDLTKAIEYLRVEKQRVEDAIVRLESLHRNEEAHATKRRGRKFMSARERREVSDRMKRYWATRKKTRGT